MTGKAAPAERVIRGVCCPIAVEVQTGRASGVGRACEDVAVVYRRFAAAQCFGEEGPGLLLNDLIKGEREALYVAMRKVSA